MKQSKIKLHSLKTLSDKLNLQPKTSTSTTKVVSSANGFASG